MLTHALISTSKAFRIPLLFTNSFCLDVSYQRTVTEHLNISTKNHFFWEFMISLINIADCTTNVRGRPIWENPTFTKLIEFANAVFEKTHACTVVIYFTALILMFSLRIINNAYVYVMYEYLGIIFNIFELLKYIANFEQYWNNYDKIHVKF